MNNNSKLKNLKKTLGKAPKLEEASTNLYLPEQFSSQSSHYQNRLDGRSMRRTNRTVRFATSVTPEFDHSLRKIALDKNMLLSEVLEEALKLYEKHINN